jgi:hypothetical protein
MPEMNAYILVQKIVRKKPFKRTSRRWEDNIKIYLREVEFGNVDWIHLARDRDQ